jgi:hypothetical protein
VFRLATLSIVITATPRVSGCRLAQVMQTSAIASGITASHTGSRTTVSRDMAIAPLQPHKSWYRHFWYAQRSPRDTLVDRTLLFAIVALSLVVSGMLLVHHHTAAHVAGRTIAFGAGSAE